MANMINHIKRSVLLTVLLLLTVHFTIPELSAQSIENPRRWSLDVNGGIPRTHFGVGSDITPIYGASIRYSASPLVTMKTAFYGGTLEGNGENYFGRDYQNNFLQFMLQPEINLIRVFQQSGLFTQRPNTIADVLDWYIYAGPGIIHSDVSVSMSNPRGTGDTFAGRNHQSYNFVFSGGTGLRFNLMPNLDLFFQYEHNLPNSTSLDGYNFTLNTQGDRLAQADQDSYGFATAGISIKFGSSSKPHAAWQTPRSYDRRNIPDYSSQFDKMEQQLANRQQTIQQIQQNLEQFSSRISQNANSNAQQDSRMNQMASRIDSLQMDVNQLADYGPSQSSSGSSSMQQSSGLRPGYYIIAAAFRKLSYANNYLDKLRDQGYSNAMILKPGSYPTNTSYYRVAYNYFNNRVDAVEQLNGRYRQVNGDAWIKVIEP